MAFPKEAFAPDLPFPTPEYDVSVVTEGAAHDILKTRIEKAKRVAQSTFRRILELDYLYYPLIDISHGNTGYICKDRGSHQDAVAVTDDVDLQQVLLDEMKRAGLDENRFTTTDKQSRGNGTFAETRIYPSQTVQRLKFERYTQLTEDGSPIRVLWSADI